ncbi:serine/threonine-protein kinase [Nocardioides sp. GCM10027113]|uniref:serine/threonine-protein kinase n=1 Tax=unclassified Nocardioides TaxID=2615069 RepID=UPI0036167172
MRSGSSGPSRLGRYAVRRRIGSGAFATVWLAYDEQLDSPVAVKVLADNWTEDHHVRRRFLEEGRFLRRVESPHVVTVHDAGTLDDGRPYLVMSYADQGTLADRLELHGLTVAQALQVVEQVGAGLQALHDRDVLHRDVKPANVLFRSVERDGGAEVRAMLGDLGLGKALDVSSRLTMIAGTPSFVAPEQARGDALDARADQYSLGALAFLLLSGRAPFAHTSLGAAGSPGAPPPLGTPDRPFDDDVDAVVRRALAPDREDRWPDVAAFVSALGQALGPVLGQAPGESPGGAPRDGGTDRWLPVDSGLTQPGRRPTSLTDHAPSGSQEVGPGPVPDPGAGRRRVVLTAVGVLALVAGTAAGVWLHRGDAVVSVSDSTASLEVTVPRAWTAVSAVGQWTPPDQELALPALSLGTAPGWNRSGSAAEGVFVGVVAGDDMPEQLPGHAECDEVLDPVGDVAGQDPLLTQVATGCPGVVVERVRQVAQDRYLWVQVRSADRATAYDVLETVAAPGY